MMHLLAIVSVAIGMLASSSAIATTVESGGKHSASNIRDVVIAGHTITITTLPVPIARLANFPATNARNGTTTPPTSLIKRVVGNGCEVGCGGNGFCSNALSPSPDPPSLGDCQTLKAALDELALSEVTNTYPCNFPNSPLCPNFVVHPGFERVYSLNTCAVGLMNLNSPGGPDVAFCDYLMAGTIFSSYKDCITNKGFTGSICFSNSNNLGVKLGLEVRHV